MTILNDLLSTVFERRPRWGRVTRDDRPFEALTADLIGATGEISGMNVARVILERFAASDDQEKLSFFRHLATGMAIEPAQVRAALDAYEAGQSKASYRAFTTAAEPPRQELIRRLNQVPGATKELVAMRADLLRLSRGEASLEALDLDFRHLFSSWFNRGFLVLRPINWESPAHILEKIIAYEAVHAIDSWEDLRRRVEPVDRRCFTFFHPAMPDEPLIFVEVALTTGIAGSVQAVLSGERDMLAAQDADTAVFYSISNCQAGLASISFGNSLIKQVAADLSTELAGLKTFVTLSPIPGLTAWMEAHAPDADREDDDCLRAFAARYLTTAKRPDGLPLDPVARFHLGNGAEVHRVHAKADVSEKGLRQSGGAMVNYLYDLGSVAQNHERFATSYEIAASSEIRALAAVAEKAVEKEADRRANV
ncbi:decarboxylase [Roseobacter sp. HKCCD9010]|uniref:malonyl-CoA decarboxylase n=1 Tax=unclassified Roseobacter TaxID=196798 RepID=UPI001491F3D4|nr:MULTISPECIES: malonyl-CoA decarboxylase [unclassified Roseobacter]MBF9051895.1 decarboxylase [Rhodobacterales bacterium HKCCD4356]NNV13888.1 decarboxylase [Roseobacter sp. HKCCD7357]NNV18060.1 decarboxylase [Roseobacter sp. HKCCD8768]NNV27520.1 decarboxylase [Roseobacter sp. HKCCD8192]NNV31787.1 decarboxylase [Roseobacter sp. HKCCD9061]